MRPKLGEVEGKQNEKKEATAKSSNFCSWLVVVARKRKGPFLQKQPGMVERPTAKKGSRPGKVERFGAANLLGAVDHKSFGKGVRKLPGKKCAGCERA